MKVRALASLSGPTGRHTAGDEFVVDAKVGDELIARGVAVEVGSEPEPAVEEPAPKSVKARAATKE
ncbi:hypothetical protein ACTXNP_01035 [Pseudomonas helleri]|uniref:hypothetical protein n=1 Tax=Pseudomonas helleri TaxID=1608996 RepID=UPI003FD10B77